MLTTPVILPPGCIRAVTSPNWIGSALDEKMIGIVVVALLAACAAGPPPAIMAATLWFTNVAANHGTVNHNPPLPNGTRKPRCDCQSLVGSALLETSPSLACTKWVTRC